MNGFSINEICWRRRAETETEWTKNKHRRSSLHFWCWVCLCWLCPPCYGFVMDRHASASVYRHTIWQDMIRLILSHRCLSELWNIQALQGLYFNNLHFQYVQGANILSEGKSIHYCPWKSPSIPCYIWSKPCVSILVLFKICLILFDAHWIPLYFLKGNKWYSRQIWLVSLWLPLWCASSKSISSQKHSWLLFVSIFRLKQALGKTMDSIHINNLPRIKSALKFTVKDSQNLLKWLPSSFPWSTTQNYQSKESFC